MADIASRFLLANLAAAVVVLLVLIIRKPARRLFGARLAYALWLLVPLAGFASFLPRVVEIVVPPPSLDSASAIQRPPVFETAPPASIVAEVVPTPTAVLSIDPWTLGWLAWLAGTAAMAAWLAYGQSRFLSDARKGKAGPAVVGVLRPRIVVPADFEVRFEPKEREVILAHERIHLSRHDAHINALVALTRCVCWFNPMIHVAAHLARIDQELACDATVAERHPKAKAVYASALLKAQLAMRPLPLGCYWPAGTEHPLTERIEMLKQAAPGRARRISGASALALLSVGAAFSAWAAMPPETHFVEAPQDQPAPAPQKPVDFSALPGFDADERLEITGEIVRTAAADPGADFWLQATEIRRNNGPAEPNAQLWRIDLAALRAGVERIMAGEELGYAPPKNPSFVGKRVQVSAYGASDPACKPDCLAQAVMIKLAPKPAQQAAGDPKQLQPASSPPDASTPSPFDNVHLVILQGRITKIELKESDSHIWLETSSVARADSPTKLVTQRWLVLAAGERNAPNWARDPKTIGMAVEVRGYSRSGYSGEENSCHPTCIMNGTAIRQLSGYPMPGITFGSGFWLPPGPPLPEPPKATSQPIQYQPPPSMPSITLPLGGVFVSNSPIKLETDTPIRLRGKVERIDFRDTSYVTFLRATSISRDVVGGPSPGYPAFPRAYESNTELWELSPTNYFGDRDAIRADLMGKIVEVRGFNVNASCSPSCKVKLKELVMPRSTEVPPPAPNASLISQFGQWYDTTATFIARGKVERVEFHERVFDAYIRTEARDAVPSRLIQARSEYSFPRAEIERELLNKTVAATGWRAREGISTFCDPVCGLYATYFRLENNALITPAGERLVAESSQGSRPRAGIFNSIADFDAPLMLKGKITRFVPNPQTDNPQIWVEAISVEPAATRGAEPATVWVVAGFPFDSSSDLVGKTATFHGFNAEDKRCQPTCLMAGSSIEIEQ